MEDRDSKAMLLAAFSCRQTKQLYVTVMRCIFYLSWLAPGCLASDTTRSQRLIVLHHQSLFVVRNQRSQSARKVPACCIGHSRLGGDHTATSPMLRDLSQHTHAEDLSMFGHAKNAAVFCPDAVDLLQPLGEYARAVSRQTE